MTLAALVGAGLGGAALKELFDDYAAAPHRDEFAAALKAGAALLWVRCADSGARIARACGSSKKPAGIMSTSTATRSARRRGSKGCMRE